MDRASSRVLCIDVCLGSTVMILASRKDEVKEQELEKLMCHGPPSANFVSLHQLSFLQCKNLTSNTEN